MNEKSESGAPEPLRPEGTDPAQPSGVPANRWTPAEGIPAPPASLPDPSYTPPPKRTAAQIRADMDRQREELGQSVDHLRERVNEITDWRSQIKKHRRSIVVGAVATGFVVGGLMALRRR
jgi:hypothetical protein